MNIIKKTAALAIAAAVALSACVSCRTDSTVKRLRQNGGLRIGYCSCSAAEDAPFLTEDGKGLTGLPASKAAASMGVETQFIRVPSAGAYEKLMNGSVDCLWNCPPPAKQYVASVRTIETGLYYRQMIMTTESSKISRLADVKGKDLAVVSGSDAQAELHNAAVMEGSLRKIVVCDSMQQVLKALASGKVQCAAVDEPQALYAAAQFEEGGDGFRFVDTPIAESSLAIVTRAEDADLCALIAEKYVGLSHSGLIRQLCEDYGMNGLLTSSIKDNPAKESA